MEKLTPDEVEKIQESQGADGIFDEKGRPVAEPNKAAEIKGASQTISAGKETDEEKYSQINSKPENIINSQDRRVALEEAMKQKAGEMKGLDPAGPAYREKEEQWNLLRKKYLELEQESPKKATIELSDKEEGQPESKEILEQKFEEVKKEISQKAREMAVEKEKMDIAKKHGDRSEFVENQFVKARSAWEKANKKYNELENLLKPQLKEAPKERTEGKKEKSVVDTETIENFVPIEQQVIELKANIVAGEHNKDTEDFLKMISEPYERVGKMKEDKNEKSLWERAKEAVARGKEQLAKPSSLKERLKGFFSGGFWEIHQAEKFRVGKKKTGKELAEVAKEIQSRRELLSYPEALKVHERLVAGGKLEDLTREKFEKIACEVKRERNLMYINGILHYVDQALQERLKNYRDAGGKQVQLDPEKRKQLLKALGQKLISMQDSPKTADVKEFSQIIKDNLDPRHWQRYAYGGVELALWAAGAWWYTSGSESALVKAPAQYAAPSGGESVPSKFTLNPGENPWDALKDRWLPENGIPNPTDMQIQATDTIVSHSTGYGVPPWDISGSPLDVHLPAGYELDVSDAYKNLEWIKNLHK